MTPRAFELEARDGQVVLTLLGEWSDDLLSEIPVLSISGIEVNSAKGFRGNNVDFLRHMAHVRDLTIIDQTLPDIRGVQYLPNLQSLNLSTYSRTPIDFGGFSHLEQCFVEWIPGAESIFKCNSLRDLYLSRLPDTDFERVGALTQLQRFRVTNSRRLNSLAGAERLHKLTSLGLFLLPSLTDLGPIGQLTELLELEIRSCKRITDLGPVRNLIHLRRLQLTDGGRVRSLAPLTQLQQLEEFHFDGTTVIQDGRLDVLAELPRLRAVSFQNRRHYSHSRSAFSELLA
jgi:Leucine-rich repeat (LRR) protein